MDIIQRHQLAHRLQKFILDIQWPSDAQEPDYVAKLVDVLPGFLTSCLQELLRDQQIFAGGAFIHQKPLAHFTSKTGYKDPELGDLLIVCREKRFSGIVYNAMLLQAKCMSSPYKEQIPNDHQYILYSEWPEFEYKRAGYLNGKKRSVLPKTITQGAQYLLIVEDKSLDLFTATVDRPLTSSKVFARTLASVLSFDAGRTFQAINPRDDWSQMILDLLSLSASAVFNRRNSGFVKEQRWKGDKAFDIILNNAAKAEDNDNFMRFHDIECDEAFTGISVICVDLGSDLQKKESDKYNE